MSTTETPAIERFDLTVGPFTFQARRAGPPDGRPVVLLHGVPQTSACWIAQLEALGAPGHHARPTLFVRSDQDPAIGPVGAYATEQHVTGPYRFVVLEGIGHWIPETAAARFNESSSPTPAAPEVPPPLLD